MHIPSYVSEIEIIIFRRKIHRIKGFTPTATQGSFGEEHERWPAKKNILRSSSASEA